MTTGGFLKIHQRVGQNINFFSTMKKVVKNHPSQIKNPNKGTSGTNIIWDKAQGNRGKQLNPNQTKPAPKKSN